MLNETNYEILERLYTSPRTSTNRALSLTDQRYVIIKSPSTPYPSPTQLARFRYGCELQRTFDHPGITKIINHVLTGASCYMVLEDIGAISLTTYLDQLSDQRVSVDVFLHLALQITKALAEVHAHYVIHKDLHAGNVLINPHTMQVQITDFDLSSLLSREEASIQPPASAEGVLGFISPEQTGRMNRSIDYRTDFYTLGVLFYLMLSGRMPFDDSSPIALVHAHIARLATPLDQLDRTIPSMLARIVDKLMAKNTDLRYQSTAGLLADLEECQRHWSKENYINEFPLARYDFSEQLQISQSLYGREGEIEQLMRAFERAQLGHPQLLTIAGYSGVGKSSLVQEAHKPIAAHGGWYISGKFEALARNIPYAALSEALRQWIQQVVAEPPADRQQRKTELLDELGTQARLLIDLQAEFTLILGELPPLTALAPAETKQRLHQVIQQFFRYIASTHPLVLFLDDLQWADNDTLDLLTAIFTQQKYKLLLILAWRDNEVSEGHLSLQAVRVLERSLPSAHRQHLTLAPLQENALKQLLIDTLHLNAAQQVSSELDDLTALLKEKTDGNPFFASEFLRRLDHDGLLYVNHERRHWEWNAQRIRTSNITDNVVALMLDKMLLLPFPTQHLLHWASCLGSRFDLATLALVSGSTAKDAQLQLWPAIRSGVLIQESGEWNASYATLDGNDTLLAELADRIHYRFLHDRMLQAAYESMELSTQQKRHRHIGQLLQKTYLPQHLSLIFTITGHLNQSRDLIVTIDERVALAQLNFDAAQRAKTASAWPSAAHHAAMVRELLPIDIWKTHYELAACTAILSVECEFLMARADTARNYAESALLHLQSGIEKANICLLLLKGFLPRGQRDYAVKKGLEGLQYCSIEVPPANLLEVASQREKQHITILSTTRPLAEYLVFKANAAPDVDTVCSLLSVLLMAGYVSGNVALHDFLGFRSIRYLLDHGLSDSGLPTLGQAIPVLLRHHYFQESFALAQRAMTYAEATNDLSARAQFYFPLGTGLWHYYYPFQQGIELLKKGHKDAMKAGDITTGVGCFSNITFALFSKGVEITSIIEHLQTLLAMMKTHGLLVSAGKQYLRLVEMLQNPEQTDQLEEKAFDPQEWQVVNQGSLKGFLQHLRLQWAFWREDFDAARLQLPHATQDLIMLPGSTPHIDHPLLAGVLTSYDESRNTAERLQKLQALREHLQTLGANASTNFAHKIYLLHAEESRLAGEAERAINNYQKAIQLAQHEEFLQYQALGSELLGNYLIEKGWALLADKALQDAYYLYGRWGCVVKQHCMIRRYPWLIENKVAQIYSQASESTDTIKRGISQKTITQLDLESLLKSMQAISDELRLSNLLSNLIHIIIENAGAQTAALVLDNNGTLELAAQLGYSSESTSENVFFPSFVGTQGLVPDELIRFVITTGKPLLMQNVSSESIRFNARYFEKHKPLSVLCLPIQYRDKITGALYLENTLTPHAFTEDRLQLLKMLLAQAAIALENARLFSEVENFNSELERKVEQRTAELRTANKELEAFSYSVSHDLRSPIRNINGFAKILSEQYNNALGNDGQDLLQRICRNTDKMSSLISGMLELSKVVRKGLAIKEVNLSVMAETIADELRTQYPQMHVEWICTPDAVVRGDERLLYSAMENLLNNAWKYSSKSSFVRIEFGVYEHDRKKEYFVRDNGTGFDMRHSEKLFVSFQRLHSERDFAGTGVGLTTVQRVIQRHGGEIRAESSLGQGATFYFTLGEL